MSKRQTNTTVPAVTIPAELAAIGQAAGVADDLDAIGGASDLFGPQSATRAQILAWLERRRQGDSYGQALQASGSASWAVELARRRSQWFAAVLDEIETQRRTQDVADVEAVMVRAAQGQIAKDGARYAPDVRAAQLFLAASSKRYQPGSGAAMPSVAIQINL